MKIGKQLALPLLAVVVGLSMIVSAYALSNRLVYQNEVQGISLSSTWTNGTKQLGTEYAFVVTYTSPMGTPNAPINFQIEGAGVTPASVLLRYNTGTGWVNATFVQDAPGVISATTMTIVGGTSGGFDHTLAYLAPGSYTLTIWAE